MLAIVIATKLCVCLRPSRLAVAYKYLPSAPATAARRHGKQYMRVCHVSSKVGIESYVVVIFSCMSCSFFFLPTIFYYWSSNAQLSFTWTHARIYRIKAILEIYVEFGAEKTRIICVLKAPNGKTQTYILCMMTRFGSCLSRGSDFFSGSLLLSSTSTTILWNRETSLSIFLNFLLLFSHRCCCRFMWSWCALGWLAFN